MKSARNIRPFVHHPLSSKRADRVKKSNHSMILTEKLEDISKKIFFSKHKKILIQYIGNKPRVYALYNENELYYVGRASNLANRINQHLKDSHSKLWTRFSAYFTKKAEFANDLEAVIISIARPKGNKRNEKIRKGIRLKDIIRKAIKEEQQKELRELGLAKKQKGHLKLINLKSKSKNKPDLKNYFEKNRTLKKTYKGKTYKAVLLTSGKIKYKNQLYNTPTAAALAVVDSSTVNGWQFWSIKDDKNNWIQLSELT